MNENWIHKYADRMYAYTRARLSDPEEVQDVIQEALLAAVKSEESFRGESEEYTWLIGILRHKIHDVYRKKARRNKFFSDNLEANTGFDQNGNWTKSIADKRSDPGRLIEKNHVRDELMDCIDQLKPVFKSAVCLRELDNMSSKDICNTLNITATNLNVILFRARVKLKKCLESKGIESVE